MSVAYDNGDATESFFVLNAAQTAEGSGPHPQRRRRPGTSDLGGLAREIPPAGGVRRRMRIGTMFLGKVEALGDESIQTKFFILGVPLLPVSSHYVVAEQAGGVRGFEIPLHAKSVLLGYVRIYAWLVALLIGVFAYIERDAAALWIWCAILCAVAVATTFGLGRLNKDEQLRRFVLRTLAGVGAPPQLLPGAARDETARRLQAAWEADEGGRAWRTAIEKGESRPLLYVLAEYHAESDLARRAFDRLKAGDNAAAGGPYR